MKQYRRLERLKSFDEFLAKRFPDSCCSMAIHENSIKKELPSGTWEPLQGLNSSLVRVASYPVPKNGLTRIWAIMDALAPTENIYLFEEAAGLERSLRILSLTRALGNPAFSCL